MAMRLLVIAAGVSFLIGCSPEKDESPTKGHLRILAAESIAPPVLRQVTVFDSLYGAQGADLTAHVVPAGEAISRLILDTTRLILTPVPLTVREEDSVRRLAGSLSAIVVAYDAVTVVVHRQNAVDRITTAEVRDLLTGRIRRWDQLRNANGKRGPIVLQWQDSADIAAFFQTRLLSDGDRLTARRPWPEAMALLGAVAADENAIGFVGQSSIAASRLPVKQLEVAAVEPPSDTAFALVPESIGRYFSPHPANVYRRYYPFWRKIMMYTKSARADVASGFGAFVASSEGQRIFLEAGLVPGTQPIRLRGGE